MIDPDVLRRLDRLEAQSQDQADLLVDIRLALARVSTSLETMVSMLRWGPAFVGVLGAVVSSIIWLVQHAK